MKLLKVIKDIDQIPMNPKFSRVAVRAVVFDETGLIPLLLVGKYQYYKIPGGGIDEQEEQLTALKRELKEEAGCEIQVENEVGRIIEYRRQWDFQQISDCYFGKVLSKSEPTFTKSEQDENFQLQWMTLGKAIKLAKTSQPQNYESIFSIPRDVIFLEQVQKIVNP